MDVEIGFVKANVGSKLVVVDVGLEVAAAEVVSALVTVDVVLVFTSDFGSELLTVDDSLKLDTVDVRPGVVIVVIGSDVKLESKLVRLTAELELATAEIWSELVIVDVGLELFTTDVSADVGVLFIIVDIESVPSVDVRSEEFLATYDVSELVVSAVVGLKFVAIEAEGVGRSSAKSFRSSIDDLSKMK